MPVMAVCPNPECGADMVIPRRLGAHVTCDECDVEWIVEDFDPIELINADEDEDWRDGMDDEDDEGLDSALPTGAAGLAVTPVATAALPQWECGECGMLHLGHRAPHQCPGCGASGDQFSLLADGIEEPLEEPLEEDDE
ncbi:MAG: hypothetical protein KIS91_01785 [Anaerolineae bacterium]|nr:hypothetical protein [Anaerolineae bacterium]